MKFLIIQFRQIGDVVLTTPLARLIKENISGGTVDFLTFSVNEQLLKHNPHIDRVISFNKKEGVGRFIKLLHTIRKNAYDVILDAQNTPRSLYCVLASGAKDKVTFKESSRRFFYNRLVGRKGQYSSSIRANLLTPFISGLNPQKMIPVKPDIYYSTKEVEVIEGLMKNSGIKKDDFIVTIAPPHRRETRRWPLQNYADAAHHLIHTYKAKVIVSWGPGEKEYILSHPAFGEKRDPSLIVDWEINLIELTALLDRSHLLIGNCSAPHHMATSQNTPTFIVFGSTSLGWCYPSKEHWGVMKKLECQPCNKVQCKFDNAIPCLKSYHFADIQDELDQFIKAQVLNRSPKKKSSHDK